MSKDELSLPTPDDAPLEMTVDDSPTDANTELIPDAESADSSWQPTKKAALKLFDGLASLRLTVLLLAMAIFIVLAGTLGQVNRDIWAVVHDYFRMNTTEDSQVLARFSVMGREVNIAKPVTWLDLSVFFPPSFSAPNPPPNMEEWHSPARLITSVLMGFGWMAFLWLIPMKDKKFQLAVYGMLGLTLTLLTIKLNGFWFPKGWTIGLVMAANLLAAHCMRFKIQSKGTRLWSGVGVIFLGILATIGVISSGSNHDGVLNETKFLGIDLDWSTIWVLFEFTLAFLLVLAVYGYINLWRRSLSEGHLEPSQRSSTVTMRRIVGFTSLAIAGVLIYLIQGGDETRLNDSGMRILWQLLKATLAGLIFLAGCVMVFRKRAGVVVLHSGVALLMLSELLVGVGAVESQMTIQEGETTNLVQDIRTIELAIIDRSDPKEDHVTVIPEPFIKEGREISASNLPVNLEVDSFYKNSTTIKPDRTPVPPPADNPATHGAGLVRGVLETDKSTGTDNASEVDWASAYVSLYAKTKSGENGKKLGTWLLSQYFGDEANTFQVDGKEYAISLRFKQTYKPYTFTLVQASQTTYVGTSTTKDFRSVVNVKDPTRNEDRKGVEIWMNNPLRFGGETFYQAQFRDGQGEAKNVTTLQVVTNDGWMIPYVACMIVAIGMLAHFMIGLLRFLNRSAKSQPQPKSGLPTETKKPDSPKNQPKTPDGVDPIQQPDTKRPWLTPALSVLLIVVFGGYLASKCRTPKPGKDGFDLYKAGQIPVAYKGRAKPLDTFARNSLRIMSNRQDFLDLKGNKQPALRWLMDVIVGSEEADKHAVYKIDYQPLLETLKLIRRPGHLFSLDEIRSHPDEFMRQYDSIRRVNPKHHTVYQKKVFELARRMRMREKIQKAFQAPAIKGPDAMEDLVNAYTNFLRVEDELREGNDSEMPLLASQCDQSWQMYRTIGLRQEIINLAGHYHAKDPHQLAAAMAKDFDRQLASYELEVLDRTVARDAAKEKQPFKNIAAQKAAETSNPSYQAAYNELANSARSESKVRMAARLAPEIQQELAQAAFPEYLQSAQGCLTKAVSMIIKDKAIHAVLMKIMTDMPRPEPTASLREQAIYHAELIIRLILENKEFSEFQNEAPFHEVFAAYKSGDAKAFNDAVDAYFIAFEDNPPKVQDIPVKSARLRFEAFFSNASPFYYLAAVYLIAGLLAAVSWLTCFQPINRATFWLLVFALVVHTAALIGRTYISGRPPVTNLYSSAVFIGWGCVLLGLIFEWFYDLGLGNIVSAVVGFLTLGVAHLLTTEVASFRGDSITVLQAVLDTQFWLATHVVCISMGYAATYVAGFFGVAYILGGAFTPLLSASRRKDLLRMVYGTLCFAILFSFVGTVLGGLWADDSWGRFWGWDTKENGALIIVLWNALVLHARWGGLAKERGLAALAVAGNIAVSWSWFGVNELGIGLHSYGFTEGVLPNLALFCGSQLLIIAIGCLPTDYWWSHIAEDPQYKAKPKPQTPV